MIKTLQEKIEEIEKNVNKTIKEIELIEQLNEQIELKSRILMFFLLILNISHNS